MQASSFGCGKVYLCDSEGDFRRDECLFTLYQCEALLFVESMNFYCFSEMVA